MIQETLKTDRQAIKTHKIALAISEVVKKMQDPILVQGLSDLRT